MPDDIVISVEKVSKAYRIWESPSSRLVSPLQESIGRWLPRDSGIARALRTQSSRSYRDFYALNNISFTVKRGDTVGIVGRNGSGKSTLLQVIAGTMQPTSGTARVTGRVAALLELGSGFNHEFTGRENVYLNCSVLGLTRRQVDERFDQIAAFAEIGDFIEQPVKTYSSGMIMRLAFACAVNVEPDILIVDEALAVGDIRFQRKCKAWIASLAEKGVTFLFVSHSPAEVAQITNTGILLESGKMIRMGPSREIVIDYQRLLFGEEVSPVATSGPGGSDLAPQLPTASVLANPDLEAGTIRSDLNDSERARLIDAALKVLAVTRPTSSPVEIRHGNRLVEIIDFGITDEHGQRVTIVTSGKPVLLFFRGVALNAFNQVFAAFVIRNVNGVELFFTNTDLHKIRSGPIARGDLIQATSQVRIWLAPGDYFLSPVTRDGESNEALDRRIDAYHFQVMSDENKVGGLVNLQPNFDFKFIGKVLG